MRIRSARLHWIELALGALLVVIAVSAAIGSHSAQAGQLSGPPPDVPGSGPAIHAVPKGIPAISPRASLLNTTGPHFTEADVQQYLAANPPTYAIPGNPAPKIVSIQFLTAKQVGAQLQRSSMGVPDNTLLCVVHLTGSFEGNAPPGFSPIPFHDGEMIFDASTGYLLVSSVGA